MSANESDSASFLAALSALNSNASSADERKRANDYLIAFQRTAACWPVATQLLLDASASASVQLFAAQTLKNRAKLMRSAPSDQTQQLQRDVLHVLSQRAAGASPQLVKQLCMALVDTSLPSADTLGQLIGHLTSSLPSACACVALEFLADEVSSLTHFGSGGSNEERVEALGELKAKLRNHAAGVFAWLSGQAQQAASSQPYAASLLNCFNAWTRLGSLHSIQHHNDLEALVTLALMHLRQPDSEAFEASADVVSEVINHCPESWLAALQEPIVSLVEVAVAVAVAGQASAAEHICRVISSYASFRIIGQLPAVDPARTLLNSLMRLAALAQIGEAGDAACWPALQAWIEIVEAVLGTGSNGWDEQHDGLPEGQIQTASQMAASQQSKAQIHQPHVPKEIHDMLDQLFVSLLNNLVAWQQREDSNSETTVMDGFTPTFMGTLTDFFAATCDILGPNRYASLLCMMMEQQQQQQGQPATAARVAAAAMHAVSAAGGRRLSSEPGALQMLAALLHKTADMAGQKAQQQQQQQQQSNGTGGGHAPHVLLMPYCCAAASSGRAVLGFMCRSGQAQEAQRFISGTLDIALQGLSRPCERDSQDLQTPCAMAIKSVMHGARDAGLPVPVQCIQTLVSALQHHAKVSPSAESCLVASLSCALLTLPTADGTRQRVQLESLNQLVQPLQTLLGQIAQQGTLPPGTDEQLRGHLRRLELLLNGALAPEAEDGDGEQQQGHHSDQQQGQQQQSQQQGRAQDGSSQGTVNQDALTWLSDVTLRELWPQLAKLLLGPAAPSGAFLTPLCRALAALMRALPARCQDSLPSIMQAMVNCMFRPGGSVVYEVIGAALEMYGSSSQCLELLQQAVQHVLADPRVTGFGTLGAADQQPELAECCAKVCSSYVRHLLLPIAARSGEAATSAVASISRIAAACTCGNHRGVALAALSCSAELVSAAVGAARAAQQAAAGGQQQQQQVQQQAEVLGASVMDNGSVVCMGIIGGLLSSYPLSRLHKASTVLAELVLLAGMRAAQTPGQPNGQSQQAQQMMSAWLSAAASGCQLTAAEQQSILQAWPPAVLEAATGLQAAAREQGLAARRLKKLLREFADLHARDT